MLRSSWVLALLLTVAACGGGGGETGTGTTPLSTGGGTTGGGAGNVIPVRYDDTTLIVRSAPYLRPPGIELCGPIAVCENGRPSYAAGQVIIFFNSNDAAMINALVAELGLTIRSVRTDSLIVNVPVLYERQWANALRVEPGVLAAEVNTIMTIS